MIKLLGYLKKHTVALVFAVLLIFVQVMSNLTLPKLMSDIINNGVMVNNISYIWKTGAYMVLITFISGISVVAASFYLLKYQLVLVCP